MHKKTTTVAALAAAMVGLSLSPHALAQSADNQFKDFMLEEVVVTATKREENIWDVPIAITAFTADAMEIAGIRDLVDIGKFVPNLNVTEFSGGQTASVNAFIRGIGLQDHLITTDPGVGVYIDGVYLGRQVGQNWSLANIERVEVLRGPQGTLYGRNSIGGTINLITKKPGDDPGARFNFEAGTRGRLNGDIYANGNLSDDWAVSVSAAYRSRDGIGDFLLIEDPAKDVGQMRDLSGRIALQWTPSEKFSLLLTADGNQGENGLRPYYTLIDEVPNGRLYQEGYRNSDTAADHYDSNTGQADQTEVTNKAGGVSLTADWAVSEGFSTKLLLSDRHSEYTAGLDDDDMFVNSDAYPESGEADQTSAEWQFIGSYGKLDFVAGLYYFKEDGFNDQNPNYFAFGAGSYYLQQKVKSKAAYANIGYYITEKFRLSGGLRFTDDEKDAYVNISDFVYTSGHRSWSETNWEVAGTYELNNGMNVYGTIQNGYQSGQFPPRAYCLFGFLDFTQPGNLNPVNCFVAGDNITAQNYEIGLKGQPTDYLRMAIAAFYTDYKDLPYQVSTTTDTGFDTQNIIVDQNSSGIEWESTLLLGSNFLFHVALGYINVDVDDPIAVAPLTPKWTLALAPEYTMPLSSGASLLFRVDYSYRDDMYGEPTADPGRYTGIDARSLVNFDFTYQSAKNDWTLSAYGRNVFDKRYDQARLNVGDYILVQLSNDASEFGLRYTYFLGQ